MRKDQALLQRTTLIYDYKTILLEPLHHPLLSLSLLFSLNYRFPSPVSSPAWLCWPSLVQELQIAFCPLSFNTITLIRKHFPGFRGHTYPSSNWSVSSNVALCVSEVQTGLFWIIPLGINWWNEEFWSRFTIIAAEQHLVKSRWNYPHQRATPWGWLSNRLNLWNLKMKNIALWRDPVVTSTIKNQDGWHYIIWFQDPPPKKNSPVTKTHQEISNSQRTFKCQAYRSGTFNELLPAWMDLCQARGLRKETPEPGNESDDWL